MCTSVEIEKRRKLEESILKYLEACPRAAHSDALRGHDTPFFVSEARLILRGA